MNHWKLKLETTSKYSLYTYFKVSSTCNFENFFLYFENYVPKSLQNFLADRDQSCRKNAVKFLIALNFSNGAAHWRDYCLTSFFKKNFQSSNPLLWRQRKISKSFFTHFNPKIITIVKNRMVKKSDKVRFRFSTLGWRRMYLNFIILRFHNYVSREFSNLEI